MSLTDFDEWLGSMIPGPRKRYYVVTDEQNTSGTEGGIGTHSRSFKERWGRDFDVEVISVPRVRAPARLTRTMPGIETVVLLLGNICKLNALRKTKVDNSIIEIPEYSGQYLALARLARKRGMTVVTRVHGGRFLNRFECRYEVPRGEASLVARAELATIRSATACVFVSNYLYRAYAQPLGSALPRAYLGYPSMDPRFLTIDRLRSVRDSTKAYRILYFGTLSREKGFDLFMDMAKELSLAGRSIVAVAAGRATTAMQARLSDSKYIKYLGPVAPLQLISEIDQSTLVVLPYRGEPFGLATLEAMARGKVVIGLNEGGTQEIINPGVDGILIDRVGDTPRGLAKVVLDCLYREDTDDYLGRIGNAAIDRATRLTIGAPA